MNGIKSEIRSFLIQKGLLPRVRKIRHFFDRERLSAPLMRFPTFDTAAHIYAQETGDYFRHSTLGLAIQRIKDENIDGSFAEVGVYRGEMTRFIHQLVPERLYYLFDTFKGFPTQDLEPDKSVDNRFCDTSVEAVLAYIGSNENILVKEGYVPETFEGLESEKFAFVLLDLDLYKPTLSSLNFFYPRITHGGYLVVHDYNSPESNWACKRALDEFMEFKDEMIIEIADEHGSVLLRKI